MTVSSTISRWVENPATADIAVPTHGFVELVGQFNRWQLASKNF